MNSEQLERLVVVEQEIKNLKETNFAILQELKTLNAAVSKYRGFIGGIIFVISGIWGIFLLFKEQILGIFGK